MEPWNPTQAMLDKLARKTDELIENFPAYLENFDCIAEDDKNFAGPGLYFHYTCIKKYAHVPMVEKFAIRGYYEYIYAILASWGMHRTGKTATKMLTFAEFASELATRRKALFALEGYSQWSLEEDGLPEIVDLLRELLDEMIVTDNQAPLIANTKVLHHILPDLVPPVDRRYTLTFFGIDETLAAQKTASSIFAHLLPCYLKVARARKTEIHGRIDLSHENWHTSLTKVIDNAIVGAPQ